MTAEVAAAEIRGWLMSPRTDTGVHLATDEGGWEFTPYDVLADEARRVARLLVDHGIGAGDTVGVLMPTSRLCLATMFGVLAAGATLTPIAPPQFEPPDRYADRLAGILSVSQARMLLCSPAFGDAADRALTTLSAPPQVVPLGRTPDVVPLSDLASPGRIALLQMTSGSTASPRGVEVGWNNLVTNLGVIHAMCDTRPGERGASWLPLHHDMGLIGSVFLSIPGQHDIRLMRPDQFIRDPLRWLRAAALGQHTVSPSFGLGYVSRRLTPGDLGDVDLSGLRSLVVGSDRIDPAHLRAFTELTAGHGFSPTAFIPCYGLAESTLIATGQRIGEPIGMVRVDRSALSPGRPVQLLDRGGDWMRADASADWIVSVGRPAAGHGVQVVGAGGEPLPEGSLGEIVLCGPSVACGYRGDTAGDTRFENGELHTGDAGFLVEDRLHVLGRMGTSLKVHGRSVFTEDLDVAAAQAMGLQPGRVVTVAVTDEHPPGVAVFVETPPAAHQDRCLDACLTALRGQLGDDAPLWVIGVPRGGLARTSSGKPRRAFLWRQWRSGRLTGAHLLSCHHPRQTSRDITEVRALFEKARALAVVPQDATVHFEGSLAEGFGNDGSDIDFLLLVPSEDDQAVMPTVLFIDGRRVEIRSQSHEQVRRRLLQAKAAVDGSSRQGVTEDLLNRVQRFLRGVPLHQGPGYGELLDIVSYRELTDLTSRWWLRRAGHCLRHSATLTLLEHESEAVGWARQGAVQAMKAFLARHGEGYLEIKWLPRQIERLRARADHATAALLDEYRELDGVRAGVGRDRELVARLLDLAARLGAPAVTLDPENVILKRMPGVTTWQIGTTVHVLRNKADVFVLSAECADSWRRVVFGQTLVASPATARCIRVFARHGLIALAWRGAGVIRPAAAMCEPDRPLTPPPSPRRPVVTIGGVQPNGDIARSPLSARDLAECAGALMLANMVLENAREDFAGAVTDEQWWVASLCGRRIAVMAVRILAASWGITPLPGDPVLLDALADLVPEHRDLTETARGLTELTIVDRAGARRASEELEHLVAAVRRATAGEDFPSSFTSREQWQETIRRGYQWLRLGHYVGAHVELDEVRDLLTSGGAQPGARAAAEQR